MSEDLLDPNFTKGSGTLPNATSVLVLGILSIVGCLLYAIPGLICGIIAMVLHKKDKQLYLSNPSRYEESYKTSRAGYICGIVGVSLAALFIIFLVIYFVFIFSMIGVAAGSSFR